MSNTTNQTPRMLHLGVTIRQGEACWIVEWPARVLGVDAQDRMFDTAAEAFAHVQEVGAALGKSHSNAITVTWETSNRVGRAVAAAIAGAK